MDFYPGDDQPHFGSWQRATENGAGLDIEYGHLALILGMNMRLVMLLRITEVHSDDDAKEHAEYRHGASFGHY